MVLGRHFNGVVEGVSCIETDSILCDLYLGQVVARKRGEEAITIKVTINEGSMNDGRESMAGRESIAGRESMAGRIQSIMKEIEEEEEQIRGVMNRLKGGYIYCELVYSDIRRSRQVEVHEYVNCIEAEIEGYRIPRYEEWQGGINIRGLG